MSSDILAVARGGLRGAHVRRDPELRKGGAVNVQRFNKPACTYMFPSDDGVNAPSAWPATDWYGANTVEMRCSICGTREVWPAIFPFVFRCACADTIVTGVS